MTRYLAYALVVAASIGASLIAVDRSAENTRSEVSALAFDLAEHSRDASLAGCARSRADREDAVRGWRTARITRLHTANDPNVAIRERLNAAAAAAVYAEVIRGYISRLVDCQSAFPIPAR